jgi:hypothetical protein
MQWLKKLTNTLIACIRVIIQNNFKFFLNS